MTRWGVVATIRAPAREVLRFAAYHLDLGATRVRVFLDAPNPGAADALRKHPRCRVTTCDDTYWLNIHGRRPVKHQVRQTTNANLAYAQARDLDWLGHIDVDEFLVPDAPIDRLLAAVPADQLSLRVRPMEALAVETDARVPSAFKTYPKDRAMRAQVTARLYPAYRACLKAGFLSHVAGKLMVRTGHRDMRLRIHKALFGGAEDPRETDTGQIALAHLHAPSWAAWQAHYTFRLRAGSYRADLSPALPAALGGMTLHACFNQLHATEGTEGLRRFFDTVCVDTPDHRARLAREGLLREHDLQLDAKVMRHFPRFAP